MRFINTLAIMAAATFLWSGTMPSTSAFVVPQSSTVVMRSLGRTTSTATTDGRPSKVPTTTTTSLSMMAGLDDVSFLTLADAVTTTPLLSTADADSLYVYFLQRLIDSGVPAVVTVGAVFAIWLLFASRKDGRENKGDDDEDTQNTNSIAALYNDLYGTTKGGGAAAGNKKFFGMFSPSPSLPKNIGLPQKEYLRVTSLNDKYDSYDFSLQKATSSKAQAASTYRTKSFNRAIGLALNADDTKMGIISGPRRVKLVDAEKSFLKKGKELVKELRNLELSLAKITIDAELKKMGMDDPTTTTTSSRTNGTTTAAAAEVIDAEIVDTDAMEANTTGAAADVQLATNTTRKQEDLLTMMTELGTAITQESLLEKMAKTQKSLRELELEFIQQVLSAVGPRRAVGLRNALLGDIAVRGTGALLTELQERPLTTLLRTRESSNRPKNLFVMRFPGDVQASQLNQLREEVTGIIRNAQPGDEALVVLQTGGGTVTGYGLAAGQLVRLKEKGLYLTVAVEQVAASGGYMMSCVADRIVASPFAVLGSIGVITEIPNFYERLKKEGVEFQTVTAGKFKRTLTPFKKATKEDIDKSNEDVERIFQLFKGWVAQNRPQLNIDEVATGETWFGRAALEKGLCDDIKTVDDILLEYVDLGYKVYDVKYDPTPESPFPFPAFASSENGSLQMNSSNSIVRQGIRWLVQTVAEEVQATLSESKSVDKRYLVKDDTADNVKASLDDFYD